MYRIPEVRQHLRGWRQRSQSTPDRIDSVFDGDLLTGRLGIDLFDGVDDNDDLILLAVCADSTVIKLGKQASYTPVACDILALPYWLRKTFQSKFLWAVLPPGAKPNDLFTGPCLQHGSSFMPGTDGIDMSSFKVFIRIAWVVSDTRGVGSMLNCSEIGSIYGACQQCAIVGYHSKDFQSRYYPGTFRSTPLDSTERQSFLEMYSTHLPGLADLSKQPRCHKRTHSQLMASAARAETLKTKPKKRGEGEQNKEDLARETMKGFNPYTKFFGVNVVLQNVTDLAHAIGNTIKDCYTLIDPRENVGKTCYVGRKARLFTDLMGQTTAGAKPGWQASKKSFDFIREKIIPHVRKRLPSAWAGIETSLNNNKTSQNLLMAGDLGCYILHFYDMDDEYKHLYARLYSVLESLMRRGYSRASLDKVEQELHKALAQAESMFPLHWCTGVRHYLSHACEYIRRCGPFVDHNMLGFERWHTKFKKLARGRRNIIASVQTRYKHDTNTIQTRYNKRDTITIQ